MAIKRALINNMMNKKALLIIFLVIVLTIGVIVIPKDIFTPVEEPAMMQPSNLLNADLDFDNLIIEPILLSEDQLLTINQISASEDLISFINSNISITPDVDLLTKQPSTTLLDLEGSKGDVAVLISEILRQKGMSSSILLYTYNNNNQEQVELIIPFRDIDEPRYIYFEGNGVDMKHHGWSYAEMFNAEELRTGRKIIEYCILVLSPGYMKTIECTPREEEVRKHYFIIED
ncbi:MAG: hypothetical protein PHC62_07985 [Candidatus Izemoplasmatales bacterium]|nr:hypothetical protein [Candidatus Izemoplasmatales bacterium]